MSKKDVMRTLLFPEFVKNSYLIEEVKKECVDFDKLYSNAKLDLMLYVVSLENDGKTYEEIIEEVTSYNKSKHFNGLDELTRTNLIKSTLKTLKR
jgi:hypothetical protein